MRGGVASVFNDVVYQVKKNLSRSPLLKVLNAHNLK